MNKDLNKLSKEIYEANKAKGFHDIEYSVEHWFCLVISELMEAVEADRKNSNADLKTFEELMNGVEDEHYDTMFVKNFKEFIKDTKSDELADAVIRLLDTARSLGLEFKLEDLDDLAKGFNKDKASTMSLTEYVYLIMFVLIEEPYKHESVDQSITYSLALIVGYCNMLNIDIWKHVELKLKYNSLRPYKHGKSY